MNIRFLCFRFFFFKWKLFNYASFENSLLTRCCCSSTCLLPLCIIYNTSHSISHWLGLCLFVGSMVDDGLLADEHNLPHIICAWIYIESCGWVICRDEGTRNTTYMNFNYLRDYEKTASFLWGNGNYCDELIFLLLFLWNCFVLFFSLINY